MPRYDVNELKKFVARFFVRLNVPPEDARVAAEVLVTADLRGVESHGVIRLHSYYGSRILQGLLDPVTMLRVVQETDTTLLLDAGNGLGMVAGYQAMRRCIQKAGQHGLAAVTVRNSNHYGIAGYYAMMALEEGMIGLSLTNSQPLVAPTYGRTRLLGTNPIAVAVPAGEGVRPFVLDMATSIVPIGRITVYQAKGQPIPAGWGVDHDGQMTTNPAEVLDGALMPLGGPDYLRGYKGYGLALVVDILCGVLSGGLFGSAVGQPHRPAGVGHFFAALRVDAFRDPRSFAVDMQALLEELRNAPKEVGQERIYIHGEKEFEMAERYLQEGVPLLDSTVQALCQAAEQVGLQFDLQPLAD